MYIFFMEELSSKVTAFCKPLTNPSLETIGFKEFSVFHSSNKGLLLGIETKGGAIKFWINMGEPGNFPSLLFPARGKW